ncbi:hypothetical protein EPUS_08336 [Endocarpon pusillum Z07020]|uniref:DUF2306 domain-containing protein n=1 Tax=Endocarpon pusillum (strain Z07020 / HMAS-L-300199) TaxID=1263415 RepID=U1GFA6_ENDPU|nr:uncharacterized protein EPUS_08336 [Endocarpon pusillum Z07020]ERF70778.1 hypothetical protein EPUS_08336 [Endocarpon pusillum Z07020]
MLLWQRLYAFLGFKKSYNALFFCMFASPLFLFALSQLLQCFTIHGIQVSQTAPGEMYWFQKGSGRVGISIHLAAILPCAILAVLQFVPAIRQAMPSFHRINGRIVVALLLIANVGALMIARHSFGGTIDIQSAVGFLVMITTIGAALAYYNIRRLQIDQHRAWMLRTMVYMGTILTARVVLALSAVIVSSLGEYRNVWPCEMIEWTWKSYGADDYLQSYPQCADNSAINGTFAPVLANIFSSTDPAEIGASFQVPVGMAFWVSIALNMAGIELYLTLTPREATRLRMESYRRQAAAGYGNPGSEGLVPEKFGDADPWVYPGRREYLDYGACE